MNEKRSLKIIQLLPELISGGVERGTIEVGKYLSEQGHDSMVFSNGGGMVEQLIRDGTRHIQMPIHRKNPISLLQVFNLRRLLLLEKPDIVHARSRVPAWLVFLALKSIPRSRRPTFITTVHGFYSVNPYSAIMTKGDRVICVSESIKDYVLSNYNNVPEKRLKVIHRGISQEEFPKTLSPTEDWLTNWFNRYPRTKNKKLLLIAGRITQLKGHECFLKLLARLPDDYHGLVVGSIHPKRENYYRNLLKQVREINLEQRVTFTGACKDMKEIYSISHATLSLSSKPESFGRTVLESLSCGCPVIGYKHGGVGEILNNCFPYGLLKLNDLDQAVSKIKNLHDRCLEITIPPVYSLNFMLNETAQAYFDQLNTKNQLF
jgi:glycosyltransferase involved in cell wall biosynthesis